MWYIYIYIYLLHLRFIATELCDGTLQDFVEGRYTGPRIGDEREILHQLTQGLAYLHAVGIVHLDIKPTNILIFVPEVSSLLTKPQIKLADFGLCKLSKTYQSDFTNSNRTNPKGTTGWMAPELYKSARYDYKADLFPLGCVFGYTLSGGKHPFGDKHTTRQNRIEKQKPMLLTIEDLKRPYCNDPITAFELIESLVEMNPANRPTAVEVLSHSFFGHRPETQAEFEASVPTMIPAQSTAKVNTKTLNRVQ